MDMKGSEILVAGYHNELATGSTNQNNAIFLATSDSPTKSSDWFVNPQLVGDLKVIPGKTDPVAVAMGDEDGHILYQDTRNDTTGVDRLGLWYAHGLPEQAAWSFRKAVGDHAFMPALSISEIDGEDVMVAAWGEGSDQTSELIVTIVDSSFSEILEVRTAARGLGNIGLLDTDRGVQIFFDFVGPSGPQIQYGMANSEDEWIGVSDRLGIGRIVVASRSPIDSDATILQTSPTGWQIRSLVDDSSPTKSEDNILEQVRAYLGLDERNFNVILVGISGVTIVLCLVVILTMSTRAIRWVSGRTGKKITGVVVLEEDVVDVIVDTDISVSSSEVELVEERKTDSKNATDRRRRREYRSSNPAKSVPSLADSGEFAIPVPEHSPPLPPPLPPIGANIGVSCQSCSAIFETEPGLMKFICPVCGEKNKIG